MFPALRLKAQPCKPGFLYMSSWDPDQILMLCSMHYPIQAIFPAPFSLLHHDPFLHSCGFSHTDYSALSFLWKTFSQLAGSLASQLTPIFRESYLCSTVETEEGRYLLSRHPLQLWHELMSQALSVICTHHRLWNSIQWCLKGDQFLQQLSFQQVKPSRQKYSNRRQRIQCCGFSHHTSYRLGCWSLFLPA